MARFISPITDLKANGFLLFFKAGTNTRLITFKDELESPGLENVEFVPVNPDGNVFNVFYSGSARVLFLDESLQQYAERSPVGAESSLGNFASWIETVLYDRGDFVKGSNNKSYESLANGNEGNDPTLTAGFWKEVLLPSPWINQNSNFTVAANQKYQVDGSAGAVDGALLTAYEIGDEVIVHNESISTNLVRLTNTALTIRGVGDTVTPSDNLVVQPGNTAHLVAKTTTILEAV